MLKLPVRNRPKAAALLLLFLSISSFLVFHVASTWQKGLTYSKDASASLSVYAQASQFLSQNLGQNETALVPMPDIFYDLNPELRGKLVDYGSLWAQAGVTLQASTTREEILRVRSYLVHFLKEDSNIKYVLRDWVDSYPKPLFEATVDDELMVLLNEVKTIPFTLSNGWSNHIIIYEKQHYTNVFSSSLSMRPEQYFTSPANASILFDLHGATVQKTDSNVNFYLPLKGGINVSRPTYLTLQVKFDVESADLMLVFYYDKNRDGVFSGYSVDYVNSTVLTQVQFGWTEGKSYTIAQVIPMAEDPVVQIGLLLSGSSNGTVTFSNLIMYTEMS